MVDYGAGNLRSLRAAFERAGAEVAVTDKPEQVARAALVIIPGVGQAASAMEALRERGLADAILAALRGGAHLFGVCVGMQLLFARSEEGDTAGLGLLPGSATQLDGRAPPPAHGLERRRARCAAPAHRGLPRTVLLRAHLRRAGRRRRAACWRRRRSSTARSRASSARAAWPGAQFHPERSGAAGAEFLRAVMRWAGDAA